MKKTFYNLIYQVIFQATKIFLPFITIPIVSKALGPEGIGVYNYTNSIAQYFVLFAGLGIGVYGNRQIAINRDDKDKLSRTFLELFFLSLLISLVSLALYFIIVSFSDDRKYFYYQSLVVIAAIFDVSWFFMGIEDFKKTSLSTLAAQIISFTLIVLFVKTPNDLGIYILIQSSNLLFSQMIMWFFLVKYIKWVKVRLVEIWQHFRPALSYFLPKIAIVLYTNLNKTLLGWMDTTEAVGFYSNTLVLNGILTGLITTVDLVLLPKMSHLFSKGKAKEMIKILSMSINIQLFLTIPAMFGIILVAPSVVPWFFGNEFLILSKTIPMVSPLVVVIPLGMAVGRQYLVPMNKMKTYNLAVILGAVVSIVTNLILIPSIGLYGAIIANLLAELFVTVIRSYAFVKDTDFVFNYEYILKAIFSSVLMYVITYGLTRNMDANIIATIIQILIGGTIYLISTLLLKANPILNLIRDRKIHG